MKRRVIFLLVLLLAALALAAFHGPIFSAAGHALVADDGMGRADAAVVLGGDATSGGRTAAAVRLYRDGRVRRIVLSGTREPYQHYESDFAMERAMALGVPRKDLLALHHRARSTREEAEAIVPRLEAEGIHSFYVVTSNYHTSRARRIFRNVAGGRMTVLAFPVADPWFDPDSWWRSEEGVKHFLMETLRQIASVAD